MVTTLHKYILKDLLKTFILATIGLTMILSLGSVLQPLQEYGVSPAQAVVLIAYFVPVILTFVMPVAALFSAALTYGRFAADNEFDACRASGVSTLSLMSSAFWLAVIVAVANLLLNFHVVPYYIGKTEENVKANVRNIVLRSIDKQGYYEMENRSSSSKTFILADNVIVADNRLFGVNMLQIKDSKPKGLISVGQADVSFETDGFYNYISAVSYDVFQADDSGLAYSQKLPLKGKFGSLMLDRIRFKTLEELKDINDDVLLFTPVREQAEQVLIRLRSELLAEAFRAKKYDLDDPFYRLSSDNKVFLLSASEITTTSSDGVIELAGVEMREYSIKDQKNPINLWTAATGKLEIDEIWEHGQWALVLDNAVWTNPQGVTGLPVSFSADGIRTPEQIAEKLSGKTLEIIENITPMKESGRLVSLKERFYYLLAETGASMAIEINSRLVFGIGCVFLVLIGAALGIIFKGGHALTSFGISVVPVAILAVFIMMGKNLTKNIARSGEGNSDFGVFIMWCGLAVLVFMLFGIYRKLLKT